MLFACTEKEQAEYIVHENIDIVGLSSPFSLGYGESVLYLSDYCLHPEKLDSISSSKGLIISQEADELNIKQSDSALAMESIYLWKAGEASMILVKVSMNLPVTFTFDSKGKKYKSVQMKGQMNAWNMNANTFSKKGSVYKTEFVLAPGKYQYKMVLDGKESADLANPDSVSNGIGGYNNVLKVGEAKEGSLLISATEVDGELRISGITEDMECIAVWNNTPLKIVRMKNWVNLVLPENIDKIERSFIRIWAFDKGRISNDILIPLANGKPLKDVTLLKRSDKHALSLYNVFIDRFYNGETSNDRPDTSGEVLPKANHMGGDIRGLINKVDAGFFEEVGVNTIWISPIVKNTPNVYGYWPDPETKFSAYHGYWPISFTLIDPRFGNAADLHELVGKAHAKKMNVLLDFVANHVHEEHPYYKAHPEVATDLYLPDGSLNTERWDDHRLTTWFDTFMPSLRLDQPEVYEMLSDSAVFWIKKYKLDGFRHDATKHVPEIFWRTLTRKLKESTIAKGTPVYQIGETYGTRELVASYVNTGQLDAQFDFNVYDACVAALAAQDGSFVNLAESIEASLESFGHHHLMGNITGNQDRARFISYAGGQVRFDEDAKKAGWTREVGVGDTVAYEKSKELFALVATLPGVPVIYYGDEFGSYGGNDPDNRKMMRFDGLAPKESDLRKAAGDLMKFRKTSLPLMYGDFRVHWKDENKLVYSRTYLGDTVFILFNNSNEKKSISFRPDDDQLEHAMKSIKGIPVERIENNMLMINLAPHSFEIID
jgi:glycosidase